MKTILKYKNRKLYDLETHKYISLKGLQEMVLLGIDFSVKDHLTQSIITDKVLKQVVFKFANTNEDTLKALIRG